MLTNINEGYVHIFTYKKSLMSTRSIIKFAMSATQMHIF